MGLFKKKKEYIYGVMDKVKYRRINEDESEILLKRLTDFNPEWNNNEYINTGLIIDDKTLVFMKSNEFKTLMKNYNADERLKFRIEAYEFNEKKFVYHMSDLLTGVNYLTRRFSPNGLNSLDEGINFYNKKIEACKQKMQEMNAELKEMSKKVYSSQNEKECDKINKKREELEKMIGESNKVIDLINKFRNNSKFSSAKTIEQIRYCFKHIKYSKAREVIDTFCKDIPTFCVSDICEKNYRIYSEYECYGKKRLSCTTIAPYKDIVNLKKLEYAVGLAKQYDCDIEKVALHVNELKDTPNEEILNRYAEVVETHEDWYCST